MQTYNNRPNLTLQEIAMRNGIAGWVSATFPDESKKPKPREIQNAWVDLNKVATGYKATLADRYFPRGWKENASGFFASGATPENIREFHERCTLVSEPIYRLMEQLARYVTRPSSR